MAAINQILFSSSDSSDDEGVVRATNGIQPYRFEPRRSADDPPSTEEGSREGNTPFTRKVDFARLVNAPVTDWCTCDNCVGSMENPLMHFCCHELEELHGKLFHEDLDCILYHSQFAKCVLDKDILRMTLVAMKDVKKASLVDPFQNR